MGQEADNDKRQPFPASEPERASIRALKNWLLAAPGVSAFDDQIVRLRIAAAIATIAGALDKPADPTPSESTAKPKAAPLVRG